MRGFKVPRPSGAESDSAHAAEHVVPRPLCPLTELVAHTPATVGGPWHLLADHSRMVGDLAADFAAPFGGSGLARLAGYLHDAGKATDVVQRRFRELRDGTGAHRPPLGVPHKVEGAQLMAALLQEKEPLVLSGYLVNYGHHSGIPAKAAAETMTQVLAAWRQPELTAEITARMASLLTRNLDHLVSSATLPTYVAEAAEAGNWVPLDLFTRMCHSTLVDADFLDTAAHFGGQSQPWRTPAFGMQRWLDQFRTYYEARFTGAQPSALNAVRRRVFDALRRGSAGAASARHLPVARADRDGQDDGICRVCAPSCRPLRQGAGDRGRAVHDDHDPERRGLSGSIRRPLRVPARARPTRRRRVEARRTGRHLVKRRPRLAVPLHLPPPSGSKGSQVVWAAPGGGIEAGELPLDALRRELLEETGFVLAVDPPHVWHQEVETPASLSATRV